MTALDRSFIKAYADFASVVSTPPASVSPVMPPASARTVLKPARQAAQQTSARPAVKATMSLAPLSAFVPAEVVDESINVQHESVTVRHEVDSLQWPDACQSLLSSAPESWENFAEHLSRQKAEGHERIAIVSCARGEGRTTIALTTAQLLSARGLRTAVVDADFEHPDLAARCGVTVPRGWGEVLEGTLPLGEALISSLVDHVTLMPWRGSAPKRTPWNASPRIAGHFAALAEQNDLVLVDTLPLKDQADVTEFATLAEAIGLDAVYLIHDVRFTTHDQLTNTCARLRRAGVRVAGIIENFLSPTKDSDDDSFEQQPSVAGQTLAAHG